MDLRLILVGVLCALTAHAEPLAKSRILDVYGAGNLVDGPSGLTRTRASFTAPDYVQIEEKLVELARKYPDRAELVVYGKSVGGRNLTMIRLGRRDVETTERRGVEISGVIHGNEYLGIEDKLVEHFLDHQDRMPGLKAYLDAGGVIYYIPIINPDGFERERRLNMNGADLNRDFDLLPRNDKRFTQPETSSLVSYLERDMEANAVRLKLTMDYHCCVPALITPWTYIDAQPEPAHREDFADIARIQNSVLGFKTGNAMDTVGYLAEGSSVDYFYAKYGAMALTIEGNYWGEELSLPKHIDFWEKMFLRLNSQVL